MFTGGDLVLPLPFIFVYALYAYPKMLTNVWNYGYVASQRCIFVWKVAALPAAALCYLRVRPRSMKAILSKIHRKIGLRFREKNTENRYSYHTSVKAVNRGRDVVVLLVVLFFACWQQTTPNFGDYLKELYTNFPYALLLICAHVVALRSSIRCWRLTILFSISAYLHFAFESSFGDFRDGLGTREEVTSDSLYSQIQTTTRPNLTVLFLNAAFLTAATLWSLTKLNMCLAAKATRSWNLWHCLLLLLQLRPLRASNGICHARALRDSRWYSVHYLALGFVATFRLFWKFHSDAGSQTTRAKQGPLYPTCRCTRRHSFSAQPSNNTPSRHLATSALTQIRRQFDASTTASTTTTSSEILLLNDRKAPSSAAAVSFENCRYSTSLGTRTGFSSSPARVFLGEVNEFFSLVNECCTSPQGRGHALSVDEVLSTHSSNHIENELLCPNPNGGDPLETNLSDCGQFHQFWSLPTHLVMSKLNHNRIGKDWTLDVLQLQETSFNAFVEVGNRVLFPHLQAPAPVPQKFLLTLSELYCANNPYHNALHGAAVTHILACLLNEFQFADRSCLKPVDLAACYIASLGHDVGHVGVNNGFLMMTQHRLAIIYNDRAILENYHCFLVFDCLTSQETNILQNLSGSEFQKCRFRIVELILSTDLSRHSELLKTFRTHFTKSGTCSRTNEEDLWLVLIHLLKFADTSHCALPWEQHFEWSCRIAAEFYNQGDQEARRGLPLSQMCDRTAHANFAESQKQFIDYLVWPLVEEILSVTSGPDDVDDEVGSNTDSSLRGTNRHCVWLANLRRNREIWDQIIDQKICIPPPSPLDHRCSKTLAPHAMDAFFQHAASDLIHTVPSP